MSNPKYIANLVLLQEMMHHHGIEDFVDMLAIAAEKASCDTEDISQEISDRWLVFATRVAAIEYI